MMPSKLSSAFREQRFSCHTLWSCHYPILQHSHYSTKTSSFKNAKGLSLPHLGF